MRLFGAYQGREISHGVEAPSACTAVARKVEAQFGRCVEDGVTIDVSVKKKADNAVVFSSSTSSSTASNPVTITGLTPGVLCVATVVVTSKSKSTNVMTKTFELASK